MRQILLCYILFLFLPLNIFSQSLTTEWEMLSNSGVYENYEIRQKHRAVIMSKSFEAVTAPKRVFSQTESNINVRFEVRKSATAYYLMFINQFEDRFPIWSSGTYIIKKDLLSGDFLQAKIFLFNNEESYIRIYPEQDRTRLDLHLFGNVVYSGIRVSMPFEKIILLPLSKILSLTWNKITWSDLFSDISFVEWRDVENFSKYVQEDGPKLSDSDDGAINRFGEYVYIETLLPQLEEAGLNCSGFTKWTVDLLYKKITGENMPIEQLKVKHYDLRGNSWSNRAEDARDPYFGLDWTRNIAYTYRKVLYPEQEIAVDSSDVNSVPYFLYKENVGYSIDEFEAVLYLAAVKNPGRIYLGSLNQPFGNENTLRQHTHVAVLFPYFDYNGEFKIDIVERQTITGVESLKSRYKGEFIHLVYVEIKE